MKKSIIFIVDAIEYGGVTSYVRQYQDIMSEKYTCILIGFRHNIPDPARYFPKAIIVEIPLSKYYSPLSYILNVFPYVKALHTVFRTYSVHAIHFSTTWSTFYALLHPKAWRIRKIITYHGAQDLELASARTIPASLSNIVGDRIRHTLQRYGLISANTIATFSRYAKNQMIRHFRLPPYVSNRIVIIPGFVKTVTKPPAIKRRSLQMLNIGRAEPRKGIKLFLRALYILKKRGVQFQTHIASPISYYQETDVLDAFESYNLFTSVHFIHAVSTEQKRQLLSVADIFIVPSLYLETFGLTIIESLSHGVPVIGLPVGAIPEILTPVHPHLVAKSVTARALVDSIMWFSRLSENKRRALQQNSIIHIKNNYTQALWKNAVVSLYE